jgi:DNA-binding CsgD family transcriptional regulator
VLGSDLRSRLNGSPGANSAEALFAVDANQRIIAWNSEAARVFGYTAATALGARCFHLVGARDEMGRRFCRLACPVIRAASAGGVSPTLRLNARTRCGAPVAVDVSTIVLVSGDSPGPVIHLCREAGAATEMTVRPGTAQLTGRERQVLRALCRGASTEAMASEMGVSATTIRNHVQHLLAKLATHSRAEAVALAFRDGLFV